MPTERTKGEERRRAAGRIELLEIQNAKQEGLLEAQAEEIHALRNELASRLPTAWVHDLLDREGAPREVNDRRLAISERVRWLKENP